MTDKPNSRSWKNFLVRRDVQLPIIAANLAFLAVVTAVLVAALLSPLYYDMLNAESLWAQNVSGNLFLVLLRRIALAMLLILIMAAAHQIILSHRFCGPLVNFGYTFEKMIRGDFSRKVHLRKNDFLKAEAAQVNTIIDRLNTDGQALKENVEQITLIVTQLKQQALPKDSAELVDRLGGPLDACRKTLTAWNHRSRD
jgi:signal transduction histidine kinase